MKRSQSIRLVLLGGLTAGALTGCQQKPAISADNFYTNNFYVPGPGYYHAPFRDWYPLPYNYFDPVTKRYFYGGNWGDKPFESITNISTPSANAVQTAQINRTDISRGGFGGSSGGHYWGGSGFHS